MEHGHDHDNRQFHRTKERWNNTPPDVEVIEILARGSRPRTPQEIEKQHPARPADEPVGSEVEPARPHRPDSDASPQPERRNESVER